MPNTEFKSQLSNLLTENKQNKIFEELLRVQNDDLRKETIILASRQNALNRNVNLNLLSREDIDVEQSQINVAILALIDSIKEGDQVAAKTDQKTVDKINLKKSRLEFLNTILGLITALIALGLAVYSIYQTSVNSTEIKQTAERLTAAQFEFEIVKPLSSKTPIDTAVIALEAINKKDIPADYDLMVFAEVGTKYYYMVGKVKKGLNDVWIHKNVVLGFKGEVRLILVMLPDFEAKVIRQKAANTKSLELEELPEEKVELAEVIIYRPED